MASPNYLLQSSDLHDDLLRPWLRAVLVASTVPASFAIVIGIWVFQLLASRAWLALLHRRAGGVAHALACIRPAAELPAVVARRRRHLIATREPSTANRDICFVPASELVRLYRARKTSPLEVMQAVLARIDAVNPAVQRLRDRGRANPRWPRPAGRHGRFGRKGATAAGPPRRSRVDQGLWTATKGIRTTSGLAGSTGITCLTRTTWWSSVSRRPAPSWSARPTLSEFGAGGNTFNALFGATR